MILERPEDFHYKLTIKRLYRHHDETGLAGPLSDAFSNCSDQCRLRIGAKQTARTRFGMP